jgi:hypothetical protein
MPETSSIEFKPGNRVRVASRDICWAESGPRGTHDYRLDVWGDTYESCVLQLAHLVWTHYGNDATLAHTANHFDEGETDDD